MAREVRYQTTRFGTGFRGAGTRWLGAAIGRLRLKLRKIDGPYSIDDGGREPNDGKPDRKYKRSEVLAEVKRRMAKARPGRKLIVRGAGGYDAPAFTIRKRAVVDPEHPFVTACKRLLGSPYDMGGYPPGPVDCSGATKWSVDQVTGQDLPHSAEYQLKDDRVQKFHDADDLESGDFVFYNFGRKPAGLADHVAFFVKPGLEIGSRPSTNGVGYHSIDWPFVIAFGRMK